MRDKGDIITNAFSNFHLCKGLGWLLKILFKKWVLIKITLTKENGRATIMLLSPGILQDRHPLPVHLASDGSSPIKVIICGGALPT